MNIENYKSAKEFLKYGYSVSNVARGFTYWQKFFLAKCQNLFYYKNLPATMPAWEIEKSLIFTQTRNKLITHFNTGISPIFFFKDTS